MSNIVPVSQPLEISNIGGELLVDSRLIALQLGIEHEVLYRTINKYLNELQEFGNLRFQNGTVTNSVGAVNTVKFAYLTEDQSMLLMTMSRNTKQVIRCKIDLVAAFSAAKKIITTVIPAQSERLRELELEIQVLKMKTTWASTQDNRIALHGISTALMLEGKAGSVVTVDRPTIEILDAATGVNFSGQTTKQLADHVNRNGGRSFKSGAELERELTKLGRADLIDTVPRKTLQSFVSRENLDEAYRVLVNGRQQQLIGE